MQRNARIAKLQDDVFHLLFSHMHGTQHSFLLILGHCSVLGSQKQTKNNLWVSGDELLWSSKNRWRRTRWVTDMINSQTTAQH